MESTKIGEQIVKFIQSADNFVATLLKGVNEMRDATKELKEGFAGKDDNKENKNKT